MTDDKKVLLKKQISQIRSKLKTGDYRFTLHALERRIERSISRAEVEEAVLSGDIIEDYPEDKYSPSCLVFGLTKQGRTLHVQCSLDPVWIITCYDPSENPFQWNEHFKKRRYP